jgi:hypothetical protein
MYDEAYLELTQSTKKQNSILRLKKRPHNVLSILNMMKKVWLFVIKGFYAHNFLNLSLMKIITIKFYYSFLTKSSKK